MTFINSLKESRIIIFTIVASIILGLVIILLSPKEKESIAPNNVSESNQKEWVSFTALDVGFQIDMPSTPRHIFNTPTNNDSPKKGAFVSEGENGTQYILRVTAYPESLKEEKQGKFFRAEIDEIISSNPKNQLLSFDELTSNFIIQNIEDGSTFQGKMIRKENTIYTFVVFYPYEKFPEKNYERFINSFSFL